MRTVGVQPDYLCRWPAEVESLTHRLIEVEIASAGVNPCDPARQERLHLEARRIATQLEAMKQRAKPSASA